MTETDLFNSLSKSVLVVLGVNILFLISVMLLDILIMVNLAFAFILLLIVLFAKEVKEFTLLPTAILVSTLLNLAVNLCADRLILTRGFNFDGRLIRLISLPLLNSGQIGYIIGYAIFILLMLILTLFITKCGTRVSEVAVRFTLDSMQIKMMAIETEIVSSEISEEEAVLRKQKVQLESDFLCSMDGASKFVSGSVKVVIFITVVIIIAGILFENFYRDSSMSDVISFYIGLSAGSGFLFMLPPTILSTAMGIIATRVATR